jgi:uncharacterized protein
MNDLHQLVRKRLSDVAIYPEGGPVEVRETHISVVFLTAEHAWKLLKPVRFDFLDFSTREARYAECWNEVRLNRRLAGDVYLDVVPVTRAGADFALGGNDPPVDWLIKMRRLPDEATLEAKIRAGTATTADLDHTLDVLQPFFERARTGPDIDDSGRVEVMRRNLVENLDELDRQPAFQTDAAVLRSMQLQFLATQQPLFDRRVAGGWVRDVHGDLRAEHVYLTDPVVIVDCIAFNHRFRHVDLLDEVCFLATDLQRLGRDDLAAEVVDRYRRRMNDPAPDALAAFFKSYRFAVRAKVACLRAAGRGTVVRNDKSVQEAAELLKAAMEAMKENHRPCLIVFCGVSGSGKSTIARRLAAEIGGLHLSSDVVRKELHGIPPDDHTSAAELYSRAATAKTYEVLSAMAGEWLDRGATVLLDATYRRAEDRDAVRDVARGRNVPFLLVHCRCSPESAAERIRRRQREGRDPSDADVAVLTGQLEQFDPPAEIPADELVELFTERPVEESCRLIVTGLPVG